MSNLKALNIKDEIISRYEIGLSELMFSEKIESTALVFSKDLLKLLPKDFSVPKGVSLDKMNPSLFAWLEIIQLFNFPFIKRELLTANRINDERISTWDVSLGLNLATVRSIRSYVARYKRFLEKINSSNFIESDIILRF